MLTLTLLRLQRISTRNAGQLLHENEHISTTWETDPGLHSLFVKKSSA
jgi:hypothetical protein